MPGSELDALPVVVSAGMVFWSERGDEKVEGDGAGDCAFGVEDCLPSNGIVV